MQQDPRSSGASDTGKGVCEGRGGGGGGGRGDEKEREEEERLMGRPKNFTLLVPFFSSSPPL